MEITTLLKAAEHSQEKAISGGQGGNETQAGAEGGCRESRSWLGALGSTAGPQGDKDKFPRAPEGTVWNNLQSRMLLTVPGMKTSPCREAPQATGTRGAGGESWLQHLVCLILLGLSSPC